MTKRDLLRLLACVDDDQEIQIDVGGCSSWKYRIGCVAMASIDGEPPVLLLSQDDDGEEYADAKGLETRRRFTDFELLFVSWIDRSGDDKNGTVTVLPRSNIQKPKCER
jgi:hypothetical protein